MIVFHGTSDHGASGIVSDGPRTERRNYGRRRRSFCTSADAATARMFAVRRTPAEDYMAGRITGVVLEFLLAGVAGTDYERTADPGVMQDEHEVAVYNTALLTLRAVWRCRSGVWVREEVGHVKAGAGSPVGALS